MFSRSGATCLLSPQVARLEIPDRSRLGALAVSALIPISPAPHNASAIAVNHGELAVPHIFSLAETCKYLGVIGDARRDDPTREIPDIAQGDV